MIGQFSKLCDAVLLGLMADNILLELTSNQPISADKIQPGLDFLNQATDTEAIESLRTVVSCSCKGIRAAEAHLTALEAIERLPEKERPNIPTVLKALRRSSFPPISEQDRQILMDFFRALSDLATERRRKVQVPRMP